MSNPLLELSDMSEDQLRQQLILLELEQRKVQLQIDSERVKVRVARSLAERPSSRSPLFLDVPGLTLFDHLL